MSTDTGTAPSGSDLPHFEETILATTRYLADIESLTDEQMREPTACPDWTRAHVITHLSRNADALSAVLRAAQEGREIPMYDSQESRDAEIEAGANRSAAEIIEDAAASWGRMLQAENEIHDSHLDATFTRRRGTQPLPVRHVGRLRRTEVEIHHADLLLGYTPADWPHDFARDLVRRRQDELADGPSMVLSSTDADGLWKFGTGQGPEITGAVGDLAWWLVGRGGGAGLVSSTGELPRLGRWR